MRNFGMAVALLSCVVSRSITAQGQVQKIPEDNLGYAILITIGDSLGSGFYLHIGDGLYLVTAGHVFFKPGTTDAIGPAVRASSPAKDTADLSPVIMSFDLASFVAGGLLRVNPSHDVAVMKVGSVIDGDIRWASGASIISNRPSGIVSAPRALVGTYDEALISNDVLLFGYPRSIGLAEVPQLDYNRPLLRAGIVAGKNAALRTLIIDSAVYPGNSGGPVLQVDELTRTLRIVGVVTQYVPVLLESAAGARSVSLANSGYAIVQPMDFVLELVSALEAR